MTSPLHPLGLPDLPEQRTSFPDRQLEVTQAERDTFADLVDGGGTASDVLAARVGLTEEGLDAGLRLGNLAVYAISGGATKGDD